MFNNKYTIEVTIDTEANTNNETMIDSKIIILSIPLFEQPRAFNIP